MTLSGTKVTMALTYGFTFSIWTKCASIVSTAEIAQEQILGSIQFDTIFGESGAVLILKNYLELNSVNVLLACAVSMRESELITT